MQDMKKHQQREKNANTFSCTHNAPGQVMSSCQPAVMAESLSQVQNCYNRLPRSAIRYRSDSFSVEKIAIQIYHMWSIYPNSGHLEIYSSVFGNVETACSFMSWSHQNLLPIRVYETGRDICFWLQTDPPDATLTHKIQSNPMSNWFQGGGGTNLCSGNLFILVL